VLPRAAGSRPGLAAVEEFFQRPSHHTTAGARVDHEVGARDVERARLRERYECGLWDPRTRGFTCLRRSCELSLRTLGLLQVAA